MVTIAQPTALKTPPPDNLTSSKALRRIIHALLACALMCVAFAISFTSPLSNFPAEKAYAAESINGTWGTCKWDIDPDGALTIHAGTGANISTYTNAPWYSYRYSIKSIVISEKVTAPENISNLFYQMSNLEELDLSGFDTSKVSTMSSVIPEHSRLTKINIGPKTCTKNILSELSNLVLISQDGAFGPYAPADLSTIIDETNSGWYNVLPGGKWGSCVWSLTNNELEIYKGTGSNISQQNAAPWHKYSSIIEKVTIADDVVAPESIFYMLDGMTNLTSLDLSGLDTSNVTDPSIAFDSCKSLTEINIGTKTLDQNILLDIEDAKFLAKNGTGELYSPAELRNAITLGNIGWYSIVPCGNWGTCSWDLIDNVLTIHKGTGKGVDFVDGLDLPWC